MVAVVMFAAFISCIEKLCMKTVQVTQMAAVPLHSDPEKFAKEQETIWPELSQIDMG